MKMLPCFLIFFLPLCVWGQDVDTTSVLRAVDSLIRVSDVHMDKDEYDQAFTLLADAEKLMLEKLGEEVAKYGTVCFDLGKALYFKKDYPEAERWYLKAQENQRKTLGKEHPDLALCLYNLAALYYAQGKFKKAEPLLVEAVPIYKKALGTEASSYLQCLRLLGIIYKNLGLYEKAEQALLEVKIILEKTIGKDQSDYAICLNSLASLYKIMGLYESAEQTYNEANAVAKKVMGEHHRQYLRGMVGLATLSQQLGNYEKAEQLLLEIKSACPKSANGEEHPFTFSILQNLGNIYVEKADDEKAEKCYLEVKAIKENEHLTESNDYAVVLHALAGLYLNKGDYEPAKELYLQSLAIFEKTVGIESLDYTMNLRSLAELYRSQGNFEKAESLYVEAKAIFEKAFQKDHPSYVKILDGMTAIYERQHRFQLSEPLLTEMFTLEQNRLAKAASFLSERELAIYTLTFQQRLDNLGSHIVTRFRDHKNTGVLPALAYNNALFHKGFLLNAAANLKNLSALSPTSIETNSRLKGYRRLLAAEFAKPVAKRDSSTVAELQENANNLEKELIHTVAGYREAIRQVTWPEVKTALKPDEAAVEFVHYRYFASKATDSILYAALVLRPGDAQPLFVPLFEEKELMPLLTGATGGNNFLKINALYTAQKVIATQKSLYELVWQPLDSLLTGSRTVYCSPSGLLHRLNLSAITNPKGQTFGDSHPLVILGSTRQLVVPNSPQVNNNHAYLAGGIRYDTDSTALIAANINNASRSIEPGEPLHFAKDSISASRGTVLDYLPASGDEVQEIGKMLGTAGFTATVDTGFYATEESFRKLGVGSPSPRIIHLATHGYFYPDPKTLYQRRLNTDSGEPVFKTSDQPMIRSGLILAGAKQTWLTGTHLAGFEDGILTAYEISQMNLSGTELVVLSACETGLGDIVGNEGVYGLQRAFKIAGAKYLIMSLWKVDDRSTQAFMTTFYRHWLKEKQRIPQAFQAAQREMRVQYPGAYDWAGFVLIE